MGVQHRAGRPRAARRGPHGRLLLTRWRRRTSWCSPSRSTSTRFRRPCSRCSRRGRSAALQRRRASGVRGSRCWLSAASRRRRTATSPSRSARLFAARCGLELVRCAGVRHGGRDRRPPGRELAARGSDRCARCRGRCARRGRHRSPRFDRSVRPPALALVGVPAHRRASMWSRQARKRGCSEPLRLRRYAQ